MKKYLSSILLFSLILLVGCSSSNNEISVTDIKFDLYGWVDTEDSRRFEYIETTTVSGTFLIKEIEVIDNDFGETPYESRFITHNLGDYGDVILNVVEKLSKFDSVGGNEEKLIPHPKVTITLEKGDTVIILEFYQNNNNEISSLQVTYTNSDTQTMQFYYLEFQEEYLMIQDLI